MMTVTEFRAALRDYDACPDAMTWLDDRDPRRAWQDCHRPDWMIWALNGFGVQLTQLQYVELAVRCARSVHHVGNTVTRVPALAAIDAAEAWLANPCADVADAAAAAAVADAAAAAAAADASADASADADAYTAADAEKYSSNLALVADWIRERVDIESVLKAAKTA